MSSNKQSDVCSDFEKFYADHRLKSGVFAIWGKLDMQTAFNAGAAAMRERCKEAVRVADEDVRQHSVCQTCYAEEKLADCIAAIDRLEVEHGKACDWR